MKQRLIAGAARVTFGAIFVVGCAAAAWAMPPASLIEALPKASESDAAIVPPASDAQRFTPPTPRIAPQMGEVLLASSVLRTLDGQAWTPPASLAAADAPAPEAATPVVETAPAATPDDAIAQALDHAAAVQVATPAAPLAEALAVEAPLVVAASPAMTAAPEAVTETPAAPPPLVRLEFNPAAVLHIEDIAAAPNESADKFPPAARLRNARPQRAAPPIVTANAPDGAILGAHASIDREPYQVQALMAAVRTPLPQTPAIPAPVQFVANAAPEAPLVQIAQANTAPVVEAPTQAAEPIVTAAPPEAPVASAIPAPVQFVADPAPTPAAAVVTAKVPVTVMDLPTEAAANLPAEPTATPAPTVIADIAPQPAPPTPEPAAPVAPARKPSLGGPAIAVEAPLLADAAEPLLQKAAFTDQQPRLNWREVINPADLKRLKNLLVTRAAAIKQAEAAIDNGDKDAVAAAPATSSLLYSSPIATQDLDLVGAYRCRITRLGGPYPQLTAYRFTTCEISQWPDGSLVVEKTEGTSRFIGRLWREPDSSFVYLGTVMPDEGAPWTYDEKPEQNQVGRLYRIGQKRLRLELPKPNTGSALDIVEFVRLK